MTNRKLLITGCARSGTLYIATTLRAAGLKVGHAFVDDDGTVSHWWASPTVRCPVLPRKEPIGRCAHVNERRGEFDFEHVWHQVRNPLDVIASASQYGMPWSELFRALLLPPPRPMQHPLVTAMRYFVEWSAICEEQAQWRYRIEDIDAAFPEMCSRLGLPAQPLAPVPRDMNADRTPPRSVTYDELTRLDAEYAARLRTIAMRYGYE